MFGGAWKGYCDNDADANLSVETERLYSNNCTNNWICLVLGKAWPYRRIAIYPDALFESANAIGRVDRIHRYSLRDLAVAVLHDWLG